MFTYLGIRLNILPPLLKLFIPRMIQQSNGVENWGQFSLALTLEKMKSIIHDAVQILLCWSTLLVMKKK